jgi:type IV pilus assembly protein PilF
MRAVIRLSLIPVVLLALLGGCASGTPQLAKPTPQQLAQDAANRAQVHTELAANYYSRQRYDVALEELNEAVRAKADYAPAYNVFGLVYMELKEDDRAAQNFEQALRLDPKDPQLNNNYGWFLCQRGQEKRSFEYFAVAQKNPLYATPEKPLVNAGICARRMKDDAMAETYFRQALSRVPLDSQALYQLADLSFAQRKYQEAHTLIERYVRVADPGPEALWLAMRIENRLGDRPAEANYAAQLRRRYPDSRESQMLMSGEGR